MFINDAPHADDTESEAGFAAWTAREYGHGQYMRPHRFWLPVYEAWEAFVMWEWQSQPDFIPPDAHRRHGTKQLRLAARLLELGHEPQLVKLTTAEYEAWLNAQGCKDWPRYRHQWYRLKAPHPQVLCLAS